MKSPSAVSRMGCPHNKSPSIWGPCHRAPDVCKLPFGSQVTTGSGLPVGAWKCFQTRMLPRATLGSRKLEYGPGTIYADVPSSPGFGVGGLSYSKFLAPTV